MQMVGRRNKEKEREEIEKRDGGTNYNKKV